MKHIQQIKHAIQKFKTTHTMGFTLVEILVAMLILGVLGGAAILAVNPKGQVSKAYDSVRQQDLSQIKNGLDLYYHDHNCYPSSINFGEQWKDPSTGTVYLPKVPQDPQALSTGYSYVYIVDTASCPQWYSLYGKLSQAPARAVACPLSEQSGCSPVNSDSTWACVYGGEIKCSSVAAAGGLVPTITPSITPSPTLSPTPSPIPVTSFSVATTQTPTFTGGTIAPYAAVQNQSVTVTLDVNDSSPILSVTATVSTDNGSTDYPMSMSSGTNTNGTWRVTYSLTDSINTNYMITFRATDTVGNNSHVDYTIK